MTKILDKQAGFGTANLGKTLLLTIVEILLVVAVVAQHYALIRAEARIDKLEAELHLLKSEEDIPKGISSKISTY